MDTTGNTPLAISREVLEQVRKDGRTYTELAKRMATVILEGMTSETLPTEFKAVLVDACVTGMMLEARMATARKNDAILIRYELEHVSDALYTLRTVDLGE